MEYKALTGIRGLASLSVVWFHYSKTLQAVFSWHTQLGAVCVSIFFCLSGYLLTLTTLRCGTLLDADCRLAFYQRRFARIAPMYFVTLLVCVWDPISEIYTDWDDVNAVASIIATPLGLQSFVTVGYQWSAPLWSLSVEVMAYILFPFIGYVCFTYLTYAMTFIAPVAVGVVHYYKVVMPVGYLRVWDFLITVVWVQRWPDLFLPRLQPVIYIVAAVGTFVLPSFPSIDVVAYTISQGGFTLLWIAFVITLRSPSMFTSFCECSPVYHLGKISYSMYVLHTNIAKLLGLIWIDATPPSLKGIVYIIAVVSIGHLCYTYIEMPCNQKILAYYGGARCKHARPVDRVPLLEGPLTQTTSL